MFYQLIHFYMGKSKTGGTRSYLRGRVGADVYSVGKNGKGEKQQVVRSLAETVANPQTPAQMEGRCLMSTVMQAVSSLAFIVDHSFDGLPAGQPSISEFIKRNYALAKANHSNFGYVKYGEKGMRAGEYVISNGKAVIPATVTVTASGASVALAISVTDLDSLKANWGLDSDEYITLVTVADGGEILYARLSLKSTVSGSTSVSSSNLLSQFDIDTNAVVGTSLTGAVATGTATITLTKTGMKASAAIVTRKENDGFIHNKAVLELGSNTASYDWSTAIATYPVGNQRFLNGGDLMGSGDSGNSGGGDAPNNPDDGD